MSAIETRFRPAAAGLRTPATRSSLPAPPGMLHLPHPRLTPTAPRVPTAPTPPIIPFVMLLSLLIAVLGLTMGPVPVALSAQEPARPARTAVASPASTQAQNDAAQPQAPAATSGPSAQPDPAHPATPVDSEQGKPGEQSQESDKDKDKKAYFPQLPNRQGTDADPLGTRLVNVTTPQTTGPRSLELLITHRFHLPVQQGSSTNLWGLDSGADVGIGLSAGIGRNVDVSFYRTSFEADYELAGKVLLLRQGPHLPLSVAVRGGVDLPSQPGVVPHTRPLAQVLLSTRIAPGFNLLVSPSWVSDTPTLHNAYNVPVGLTFPFPGNAMVELEVIPPNNSLSGSQTAWHAALSKAVGWHIFKLVVGNSRATTLDQMLGGDSDTGFKNRDVRLGFNLVRYFKY